MNIVSQSSELHDDAKLVIDIMNEKEAVQLDFSADSISWLDTYITQHRNNLNEHDKHILGEMFGAFVGETILQNYGGQWDKTDSDEWTIMFDDELHTSPFEMIREQLDNETSLTHLYQRIPELFDRNASHN